jgi:ribosomal protein S18 acetylase RimI-like enzyme
VSAPAIRAVTAGDATTLRHLRLRALEDAPDAFGSALDVELAFPDSEWVDLARRSEAADDVAVYAAVDGERWVGMAAGRWYDREHGVAGLWGMWVDPAARGVGLGERLVDAVHQWAAAQGARILRLGVVTGEGDATGFYERLGFTRTGETGTLRRDPTRAFCYMTRPI